MCALFQITKPGCLNRGSIYSRLALLLLLWPVHTLCQSVPWADRNESLTWEACIDAYRQLDNSYSTARLIEAGTSDCGKPLHVFIINKDEIFYPELFDRTKTIVLINNGIHPGEPDGIDASVQFCRDLLDPAQNPQGIPDSVILCVIPVYNVDGALNRNSHSRANQDGPAEYGFRGNARNLDLNRDFIKCDSRNALAFNQLFTRIRPHVFVDTHVSNGADYSYVMTLISTQCHKLGYCGPFLREQMEPALFESMKERGHPMCPYVNTMGRTPESGLVEFLESPRFASGYAALFNTIGFITETHMLKPFPQRVEATYQFLDVLTGYCNDHSSLIVQQRRMADEALLGQSSFPLRFELDTTVSDVFRFRGYTAEDRPALVGSGKRLYYDHSQPWDKNVPFYRTYVPAVTVDAPDFYIVPQAWTEVIERLRINGVRMLELPRDTVLAVSGYYIDDFSSPQRPYEGHYLHESVSLRPFQSDIRFFRGDWMIPLNQAARRYLIETLEPQGEDSFFTWNFFDSALQQKEWFSDYVFEEKALEILNNDAALRSEFDHKMKEDAAFAASHWQQLYWIYKRSDYYEESAFRYPVFRFNR